MCGNDTYYFVIQSKGNNDLFLYMNNFPVIEDNGKFLLQSTMERCHAYSDSENFRNVLFSAKKINIFNVDVFIDIKISEELAKSFLMNAFVKMGINVYIGSDNFKLQLQNELEKYKAITLIKGKITAHI